MKQRTEFLEPRRKLVDEVVGWLCGNERFSGRIMSLDGAHALSHVMVVVPTAQSGRNLRLALAKEAARRGWGGILPPRVVLPMALVKPADETLRTATDTEIAASFQQYVHANKPRMLQLTRLVRPEDFDDLTARFALLDQLQEIWRILAGDGLLMCDVSNKADEVFADDISDEKERWHQLAELERGFFSFLHDNGMRYPTEAIHMAKMEAAVVSDEITEIVLPALADPIHVFDAVLRQQLVAGKKVTVLLHASTSEANRFGEWGRPLTAAWTGANRPVLNGLADEDIVCSGNSTDLAQKLSGDFPPSDSRLALPALSLCDSDLLECVTATFLNRGYVVHDPERHRLAQSSLGHLIGNLMAIYLSETLPWRELKSLMRSDDVLSALKISEDIRMSVLKGLDVAQNTYLPTEVGYGVSFANDPDLRPSARQALSAFCECGRTVAAILADAKKGSSMTAFVRRMLQWTFADSAARNRADAREFEAAATATREMLAALESPFVAGLPIPAHAFAALVRRELDAAVYSLEPDAPDALKTEGWLELGWSMANQIALAGFHEGKVPDVIVGHPFLPDSLRQKLGLVSNADRLARDTWLLKELLDSHAPHAVRAYVSRATDVGDICRPSRLAYLCSDNDLHRRISALFGDIPQTRTDKSRHVEWTMHLPATVPAPDHLSPSAIDTYVNCPFTYLLKYGLKMRPYEENRELAANDFGTLAHAALRMYADGQIARGDDQLTDATAIRRIFHEEIFPVIRAKFGRTTLNIDLQIRALEGRLDAFADIQAEWALQGWRIRMAERDVSVDIPELGCKIKGQIDRVDENISDTQDKSWCVIDYKTWDENRLIGHVVTSSADTEKNRTHLNFARRLDFPLLKNKKGEERQRILSVQLPVYGKCLETLVGIPFSAMRFQYLVLGKTAGETGFSALSDAEATAAVQTARRAVSNIGDSVFWPPGPGDSWKWDFADLFVTDPMTDLGSSEWAREQDAKTEAGNG